MQGWATSLPACARPSFQCKAKSAEKPAKAGKPRVSALSNFSLLTPHSSLSKGFTLLEMLVVILLIGIATAAVSVSVSQGLTSARVNAASGEMAAALRATRAQAIVQGKEQTFAVNTRDNTYTPVGGKVVRLPQGMTLGITSAAEDQLNSNTGRIRFFPDGSSTGGHVTLKLQQRQWLVNVSWLTGAVSVVVQ
jgi:general secretion pathway protein H